MHRRYLAVTVPALLALSLVACPQSQVVDSSAIRTYSIEKFLDTEILRGGSISADGSQVLASSDRSGIFNAYSFPVTGGEATQLTASTTDSILALEFFPADHRFLYSVDQGGNELTHIHVQELDGSSRNLTPGDSLKAVFLDFAADGRSFFLLTNERDQRYFDLYEYAVDDYRRTMLYRNEEGYEPRAVSADRNLIALNRLTSDADSDIYLHDRQARKTRHLTPHEGEAVHRPLQFTPQGSGLIFLTDQASEFLYLARLDLDSLAWEVLARPGWDVRAAEYTASGRLLVVEVNNDARTEVHLHDSESNEEMPITGLPIADISSVTFSADDSKMAFLASSSRHPRDLFVLDRQTEFLQQLTHSLSNEIDPADLAEGEIVRFDSFDHTEIPGILYLPRQASKENPVPALVLVHGGPGGQSRVGYQAGTQFLVNHGYAVFAINNRGSSGYGKTFYHLDDHDHGQGDLDDCIAAKSMLVDTGLIDPQRIGILGGSYGGYMVLAALTFRPLEFAVGVDMFGISNWVRTLNSIPPWWEARREALYQELGDPRSEVEYLRRISPLFHAGNIVRPLLVLQGANDPRVLQAESDEIVAAARSNGATVEYLVFDDEGHGFRKKENQLRGHTAILQFLDTYLKGPASEG